LEKTAAIKTSSANGYGTTIFPWLVAKPLALRQAILSQVGAGPRLLPLSSFQKPDGVGGGGCSSSSSSPSLSSGGGGH
jgi:hypothetical protein